MARDNYATPIEIFRALDQEFCFGFDVCADESTAKCDNYWTIEDDALSIDWKSEGDGFNYTLWCNPPYSDITPWVMKSQEAQRMGCCVVMLVMADPSVHWFRLAMETVSEVRFIHGRISFIDETGKPMHGNNKGNCIFVFDPHRIGTRYVSFIERDDLIAKGGE